MSTVKFSFFNTLQNLTQFIAQENRNNSWRRFVSSKTMIVTSTGNRNSEQILIFINRFNNCTQEQKELSITCRSSTRVKQIFSSICRNRPVVVFTTSVYTSKRFFMQKTNHTMFSSNFSHHFHSQLVVITSKICSSENRSQFMLSRSNFVMFSFGKNSKLPQFIIQILHKSLNTRFNHTKIMILKFLTFWSLCTKQSSSSQNQIFTFIINRFINQKIFLFRTNSSFYAGNILISKQMKNTQSLLIDSLHRTEQWSFLIQSFTSIRTESSRNAQSSIFYKCVRSWIPSSITTSFKSSTQTTTWKRRSIRFTLHKFLSTKFHNNFTFRSWRNKTIMFFSSNSCQRLEPVSKMSSTFFQSPVFHSICNDISYRRVKFFTTFNSPHQLFVSFFRQTSLHHRFIKNVFTKN